MLKRILIWNRRLIRRFTPLMFMLGAMILIIYGVTLLTQKPATINVPDDIPWWAGYLFLFGGFVLALGFTIDCVIKLIPKNIRNKNTLAERVKSVEEVKIV